MMGRERQKSEKNKGFTLIEVIIVVAIFAILLGIMIPSLNSILGFHVRRTTESVSGALDRTKTEAMNRLAAEFKLSYVEVVVIILPIIWIAESPAVRMRISKKIRQKKLLRQKQGSAIQMIKERVIICGKRATPL